MANTLQRQLDKVLLMVRVCMGMTGNLNAGRLFRRVTSCTEQPFCMIEALASP